MRWIARWRWLLARHPWIYWTMVAACAASFAVSVVMATADLRRAREEWGATRRVAIAARALAPGDALAGAVTYRDLPVVALPPSAVGAVSPDATARQRISTGEVVVDADVAPLAGVAALLPDGWLAVDVPLPDSALGDGVSLLTVGDSATVLADGAVVAASAVVVGTAPGSVAIGVPADDAPAVAAAANARVAVVALSAVSLGS